MPDNSPRLLRSDQVMERTGLKRSMLFDLIARGLFPRPCHITPKLTAWPESEVVAWIEARIAERGAQPEEA